MNQNKQLGKICSMAKKGTIIKPKRIPGYITPEGQVLTEPNQHFKFHYKPIQYTINYELDGGVLNKDSKHSYTIEDAYIPPMPSKKDYTFIGWDPKQIDKGSMGDVTFIAQWKPNAILVDGPTLNSRLSQLAFSKEYIMAIKYAKVIPTEYVDISSTSTPIMAFYEDGIVYIYSKDDIYCNSNMQSAFEGFTLLRDISGLANVTCLSGTNINSIFKDCELLSDLSPIINWANNGDFSDFKDAFTGTPALASGRIPKWYRWKVEMQYVSESGKCLGDVIEEYYPGEIIRIPDIDGYDTMYKGMRLDEPKDEIFYITYFPKKYSIKYELNGGFLMDNKKEVYTIEDETYIPPIPYKAGYRFDGWTPLSIEQGSTGNITFHAHWSEEENS